MRKALKNIFKGEHSTNLDNNKINSIFNDDKVIISPDTQRKVRIPPGQHEDKSWPVLHAGSVPKTDFSNWRFKIWGLVEAEIEFSFKEFMALHQVKVFSQHILCHLMVQTKQPLGRCKHFYHKRNGWNTP